MKTLLLINPIERKTGLGAYKSTTMPPLALAYVAAATPDTTYNITIIDENIEELTYPDADLVGITSYTAHIRRAYEICEVYRKKSIPVVMGGIHVSTMPEEALRYCDAVVIGEAEAVWAEVLKDFEANCLKRVYKADNLFPLEHLPMARRTVLQNDKYLWGAVLTSRGCPMDCSFCSVTRFNGRRFRRRRVDDVVRELAEIKQKFVVIVDDNILGHENRGSHPYPVGKDWLEEFFQAIIKSKLKKYFYVQTSLKFGEDPRLVRLAYKAGVRVVLLGIESVEPESLSAYDKHLNAAYVQQNRYLEMIGNIRKGGMVVIGCFILGCDSDTLGTFQKTLDFIVKARIDILQITRPTPLPGTRFYQQLYDENRIICTDYPEDWKHYTFGRMLFKPLKLDIKEVYQGIEYVRSEFFRRWMKIRRFFLTLLDTRSISSTLLMLVVNHSYEQAFIRSINHEDYHPADLKEKFYRR